MKGKLLSPGRQSRTRITRSRKQETRTAKEFGGKRTPGSGNKWFAKGDVHTKNWAVENKTTESGRFTLSATLLRGYAIHAAMDGKKLLMQIDLSDDPRDRYVLISLSDAKEVGLVSVDDDSG